MCALNIHDTLKTNHVLAVNLNVLFSRVDQGDLIGIQRNCDLGTMQIAECAC